MRTAGEEHLALTRDAHEVTALPGGGLLDHAAQAPRPLVGEVDVPLVGDHRALRGQHLRAQGHTKHLAGLDSPALAGLLLTVGLLKKGTAHVKAPLFQGSGWRRDFVDCRLPTGIAVGHGVATQWGSLPTRVGIPTCQSAALRPPAVSAWAQALRR